jgi:hypothetical protein
MTEIEAEIMRRLDLINIELRKQSDLISLARMASRKEKAKAEGVHPTTSWRREQKQRHKDTFQSLRG